MKEKRTGYGHILLKYANLNNCGSDLPLADLLLILRGTFLPVKTFLFVFFPSDFSIKILSNTP